MLELNKRTTIAGASVIDGVEVCAFTASIDFENPENTHIGQLQRDKDAYKQHREECRADFAAFEDAVIAEQERIFALKAE